MIRSKSPIPSNLYSSFTVNVFLPEQMVSGFGRHNLFGLRFGAPHWPFDLVYATLPMLNTLRLYRGLPIILFDRSLGLIYVSLSLFLSFLGGDADLQTL
jgi:hypothetical protein